MDEFFGKEYQATTTENFDEFLTYMGYNIVVRKAAANVKPVLCLKKNEDGSYTLSNKSTFASTSSTFHLGEEFDEALPMSSDKSKSTVTFEGNKMIHIQKEKTGKVVKHVRTFYPDKMTSETTVSGWDLVLTRQHVLKK